MKKFFLSAAIMSVAAIAGLYCYNQKRETEMSDLAKANLKALAIYIEDMTGTDLCFNSYEYISGTSDKAVLYIRPCNNCDNPLFATSCRRPSTCKENEN